MEAPTVVLDAPKDTPFTAAELAKFDGKTPGQPIYVAMKGIIFDGESSPQRSYDDTETDARCF